MQFLIASIYFVAFGDFLARWMPASPGLQSVFSQLPEILLYIGILVTQSRYIVATGKARIIGNGIDSALFLFLGWSLCATTFVLYDSLFINILNIKALVRFVFVFYLVSMIQWNKRRYFKVLSAFYNVFLIQMAVGMLQIIFGQPAIDFFSPQSIEGLFGIDRIAFGDRDRASIEIFGSFRNTISFAYLMMIGVVILLSTKKTLGFVPAIIAVILALVMIVHSGSRIVILCTLIILFLKWSRLETSWKHTRKWLLIGPFFILSAFSVYMYILSLDLGFERGTNAYIFTSDYVEGAMNQRLGIISRIVPQLNFTLNTLLGFGADKIVLAEFLSGILNVPNSALLETLSKTIEDVYWVAIFLYYGVIGLSLFVILLFKIYIAVCRSVSNETQWISEAGVIAKILLLFSVPLNFVNQAFEVQVFSLALWTFAAIAIKANRSELLPDQVPPKYHHYSEQIDPNQR